MKIFLHRSVDTWKELLSLPNCIAQHSASKSLSKKKQNIEGPQAFWAHKTAKTNRFPFLNSCLCSATAWLQLQMALKTSLMGLLKTRDYKLISKEYTWFQRQRGGFNGECAPEEKKGTNKVVKCNLEINQHSLAHGAFSPSLFLSPSLRLSVA